MGNKIPDYQKLEIQTLSITALAFGGDGMARDEDGATIFVPYGLPGDVVRVRNSDSPSAKAEGPRGKMARGPRAKPEGPSFQKWSKIIDVVTPSPDRLENLPCVHCFDCGGCALQHMRMAAYQDWKYKSVLERLQKAGVTPQTIHPLISVSPKSRRRATFAARREKGRVVVGFNRHHAEHVVDLVECHVVIEAIVEILPALRTLMDTLLPTGKAADISVTELDHGLDVLITAPLSINLMAHEAMAEFVQKAPVARLSWRDNERAEPEVLLSPMTPTITVGGVKISPRPGFFLQPSRAGEEALINCVRQAVGKAGRVADLFCGLGTFSYPLAASGASVTGWDVAVLEKTPHPNPLPVARGEGIDRDGPGGVSFKSRNLYREPVTSKELAGFEAIVFDPPRAGAKAQAPEIAAAGVRIVVAVSCNPGTLVGDLRHLIDSGYLVTDVWVVDQFTWSAHVEVVVRLTR